jgi:hypothetical protein
MLTIFDGSSDTNECNYSNSWIFKVSKVNNYVQITNIAMLPCYWDQGRRELLRASDDRL